MLNLMEGKKHVVIKRDGRTESFNWNKLNKVLDWAITHNTNIKEPTMFRQEIIKNLNLRIGNKITIQRLFDNVIEVTANLVSLMYPVYDEIARNLYLQKLYKEIWSIKRNEYPDYNDVLLKGIRHNIYNKDIIGTFEEQEITQLNKMIINKRDFLFSFSGLMVFIEKYSKKYNKNKYLELPQHVFMREAIQLHYKDNNRLELIKKRYDMLSKQYIASATPFKINSLKEVFNPTSCVLIQADDDSESIMETARSQAIYSKHGSGLGVDITRLRAIGSPIGKNGVSSGVIPFIKIFEATISAFNQLGSRPGSAAIYYPWWHYETPEIINLKDAGGTEDTRARKLKFAIKWNDRFNQAVINDEEIYLFDPKDTPELIDSYSREFNEWYNHYSKKNIKKRKINARDLAFSYIKSYIETGHNYWFNLDNANKFNVSSDFINQGNLCCSEVLLPTKPLKLKSTKIIENQEIREYDGEIGICNLTSIDVLAFDKMNEVEKDDFIYTILVGMDNSIEYGTYPVKAGEKFNKLHRAIGIGITNYQMWLASKGLKLSDKNSLKETHTIMESLYYYLVKNSIELAKQRGKYYYYKDSLWEKGKFIWELYKEHFNNVEPELNYDMTYDWEPLRKEMMKYGVRFEFLSSIPPGATSSLVLNKTESIEPVRSLISEREGTFNVKRLAPGIKEYRQYYENVWNIPMEQLLKLTAVRQKFIDQGQSVNFYLKEPDSAYEVFKLLNYANKLGIKSLYYMTTPKKNEEEQICEGCAL